MKKIKWKVCFFISFIFLTLSSFGFGQESTQILNVNENILSQLGSIEGSPIGMKKVELDGKHILVLASSLVTKVPPRYRQFNKHVWMKSGIEFYFFDQKSETKYSEIQAVKVSGYDLNTNRKETGFNGWMETADLKGDGTKEIIIRIITNTMVSNCFVFEFNDKSSKFNVYSFKNAEFEKLGHDGKTQIVTIGANMVPPIYELTNNGIVDVSSKFPDYYKKFIPIYLKGNDVDQLLTCYKLAHMRTEFMNLASSQMKVADAAAAAAAKANNKSMSNYCGNRSKYFENIMNSY